MTPEQSAALVERLRSRWPRDAAQTWYHEPSGRWTPGLRNPDGPEAADLIESLTSKAGTANSDLIARIDYILDPSASATERAGRRAHLTNHDLRTCRAALAACQPMRATEYTLATPSVFDDDDDAQPMVEEERERIVAWLREQKGIGMQKAAEAKDRSRLERVYVAAAVAVGNAADATERGDHLPVIEGEG